MKLIFTLLFLCSFSIPLIYGQDEHSTEYNSKITLLIHSDDAALHSALINEIADTHFLSLRFIRMSSADSFMTFQHTMDSIARYHQKQDVFIFFSELIQGKEGLRLKDKFIPANGLYAFIEKLLGSKQLLVFNRPNGDDFFSQIESLLLEHISDVELTSSDKTACLNSFKETKTELVQLVLQFLYTSRIQCDSCAVFSEKEQFQLFKQSNHEVALASSMDDKQDQEQTHSTLVKKKTGKKKRTIRELKDYTDITDNAPNPTKANLSPAPPPPPAPTGVVSTIIHDEVIEKGETLCLMIGCDAFDSMTGLRNAWNDTRDIASILRKNYKTTVIQMHNPSYQHVYDTLGVIARTFEFKEGSQFLLYVASHGATDLFESGYLLLKDSKIINHVFYNAIPLTTLKKFIGGLPATNTLMLLDICHSGTMFDEGMCIRPSPMEIPESSPIFTSTFSPSCPASLNFLNKESNLFFGSSMDQVASDGSKNHSPFSSIVIDFLKNNALPISDSQRLQKKIEQEVMLQGSLSIPMFCAFGCEPDGRFLFIKK